MSANRSSTSSKPTLIRMRLGVRPDALRSSSDSGEVDMSHGILASDSTPPKDSASVNRFEAVKNFAAERREVDKRMSERSSCKPRREKTHQQCPGP